MKVNITPIQAVEYAMMKSYEGWFNWEDQAINDVIGLDDFGLFIEKVGESRDNETDSYGYYTGTGEQYMIFRVTDVNESTRYFKKYGSVDSYGERSWNGDFVEVFPKVIEVVSFE